MAFYRTQPLRVLILDNHAIFLRGLNTVLSQEPDLEIVGCFSNSHDLTTPLMTVHADVLIIDHALTIDDHDDVSVIHTVQQRSPELHVLVVSASYDISVIAQALRQGIKGFISRNASEKELLNAVYMAGSGTIYLEPQVAMKLAHRHEPTLKKERGTKVQDFQDVLQTNMLNMLSPKVQEVMLYLMSGMTVSEIALKSSRSIKTVSGQKQMGMRKLGIRSDRELFLLSQSWQASR